MTRPNGVDSRSHSRSTRPVLAALIIILLLALCGIAYVVIGVVRSPERQPVLSEQPGVVWEFSAFGGTFGKLSMPDGVAFDGERIYVTEPSESRITVFDSRGDNGDLFATAPVVEKPKGVAVAPDGSVYVADESKQAVVVLDGQGGLLRELPIEGVPYGVAVSGERLYVSTSYTLYVMTLDGTQLGQWGEWGRGLDELAVGADVAVGQDGTIYLTDLNNYRVVALTPDLVRDWQYGATATTREEHNARALSSPYGITLTDDGEIYFVDGLASQIGVIDRTGASLSTPLGSQGSADDQFYMPKGIAWMGEDLFVVADTFHGRIVGVRLTPQAPE